MKTFEDLPIEIQFAVFRRLGVKSLAVCRMVCRNWQALSDQMKPTELVLNTADELCHPNSCWHQTGEPIDQDSLINRFEFKNFRMMSREITLNLSRLKRLKIACRVPKVLDDFFLLNAFYRLEHLELVSVLNMKFQGLRLPNLRSLRIDRCDRISIDSPKLQTLSCDPLDALEVKHPLTITELEIDRGYLKGETLVRFQNVTIFKIKISSPFLPDDVSILTALPKLKELRLVVESKSLKLYEESWRSLVDSLIDERASRRRDLRLFFGGHLLEGDKRFDDYDFKKE